MCAFKDVVWLLHISICKLLQILIFCVRKQRRTTDVSQVKFSKQPVCQDNFPFFFVVKQIPKPRPRHPVAFSFLFWWHTSILFANSERAVPCAIISSRLSPFKSCWGWCQDTRAFRCQIKWWEYICLRQRQEVTLRWNWGLRVLTVLDQIYKWNESIYKWNRNILSFTGFFKINSLVKFKKKTKRTLLKFMKEVFYNGGASTKNFFIVICLSWIQLKL